MSRWVDEACMHGSGVGGLGGCFWTPQKGAYVLLSTSGTQSGNTTQKQSSLFISWKAKEQVFQSHALTNGC